MAIRGTLCPWVFNAFKYVDELRNAGIPDKQAEAQVRVLQDIVDSQLATKRDLKELEASLKRDTAELKRDTAELETSLRHDIKET